MKEYRVSLSDLMVSRTALAAARQFYRGYAKGDQPLLLRVDRIDPDAGLDGETVRFEVYPDGSYKRVDR